MQQTRYLREMEKVVFDKGFASENPDLELYYMERGVERKDGLRYDITVIPSQMLGEEFTRTKGHCHAQGFPELYTVLEGEAIFFFQKGQANIKDVFAVLAKKGDWVLVPRDYSHITINPKKEELKIGNWVCERCDNVYESLEKMGGPCYFYTKDGWIKNKNYKEILELRFEKPLKERPENLDFLR